MAKGNKISDDSGKLGIYEFRSKTLKFERPKPWLGGLVRPVGDLNFRQDIKAKAVKSRNWLKDLLGSGKTGYNKHGLSEDDNLILFKSLMFSSPRLRGLIKQLADQILRKQGKAIVWSCFPATHLLISTACQIAGIDTRIYDANLSINEKNIILEEFQLESRAMVLISFIGMTRVVCRNLHIFDDPAVDQAERSLGRHHFGQESFSNTFFYHHTPDGFCDQLQQQSIFGFPSLVEELNRQIFQPSKPRYLEKAVEIEGSNVLDKGPKVVEQAQKLGRSIGPEEFLDFVIQSSHKVAAHNDTDSETLVD